MIERLLEAEQAAMSNKGAQVWVSEQVLKNFILRKESEMGFP